MANVVRIFMPHNRLAAVIGGDNDPTLGALARDAEARVATLKDRLRDHVHARCDEIARLAAGPEEQVFGDCLAIDRAALDVCEVAGAAGLVEIGEIARGLHEMARALVERGMWHADALRLHLDALVLMRSELRPGPRDAEALVQRLATLRRQLGLSGAG